MNPAMDTQRLELDLTQQEPIPPAGVQAALALMASGKLHRYGEAGGKPSEVSALEVEFARELGVKYCVALNSGHGESGPGCRRACFRRAL